MLPAFFASVILEIGSYFCAQASLDCNPPILSWSPLWDDKHVLSCPAIA
jgi:hypothetical protein